MSDAPRPMFLKRFAKGAKRPETAACALLFDPQAPLPVATIRLSWSALMAGRLRELARAGAESGRPEGHSLPYASLRAAIQVALPDCVMLSRDLGRPWAREDGGAFMQVAEGMAGNADRRLCGALRDWAGMVLRPWADRLEIDEALVDAVDDACSPDLALIKEGGQPDLLSSVRSGQPFHALRTPILQEVGRRLDGLELFEGLGPVYRIVRGRSSGNEVQFMTWPTTARSGGLFSMVASLTLETAPYLDRPLLIVRASRRRWLDDLPSPTRLRRQRTLTGYLMGRGGSGSSLGGPLAVEFSTPVRAGVPDEPASPEYMAHALAVRANLARPLAEMVQARGQDVFLGVPYSPQRDHQARVGSGASTRDQIDLLDAVARALEPMGMRPLPFSKPAAMRTPRRSVDLHKALETDALVANFALSLGVNDLNEDDLLEAAGMLLSGGDPPRIDRGLAEKAHRVLQQLQSANRQRLRRSFGDAQPTIVVVARRQSERDLMQAAIDGLFGSRLKVAHQQLPEGVHGLRADLPDAGKMARERFAARVEAWRPMAEALAAEHGGCHALVQADEWYSRKPEDRVNKPAGRHALAVLGDANVQYLLPPEPGWRGLALYLHRIQAAVYDLIFGHSALISEIGSLAEGDFPDPATRPRAVVGISVVTQARLRGGGQGGQICLATRVDVATGRTTARVGWHEGAMQWTPWRPFFEAMKHVASLKAAYLGADQDMRKDSFQAFAEAVIDESVADGDRPLVLLDATSAAGLWPWLADSRIAEPPGIGREAADKSRAWAQARLVRVRCGHAGRVLERVTVRYEVYDHAAKRFGGEWARYTPTAIDSTIELSDGPRGARHYWVTSGYSDTTHVKRGLSVYRILDVPVPATSVKGLAEPPPEADRRVEALTARDISDEPYRVPNAIDVTVAWMAEGDDPAAIVHMVASLRLGYGHSSAATALPAPLFFEAKARDYMARFDVAELEADEEGGPTADPDEAAEEAGSGEAAEDLDPSAGEGWDGGDVLNMAVVEAFSEASRGPEPQTEEARAGQDGATPADAAQAPLKAAAAAMGTAGRSDAGSAREGLSMLGRWSRTLQPSRSVWLVETSLAGFGRELRLFDTPVLTAGTRINEGAVHAPMGGAGDAMAKLDLDSEVEDVRGEGGNEEASDAAASDEERAAAWLAQARGARVPVPAFATPEWMLRVSGIPSNPHLLKAIGRRRDVIRRLSGYAWPELALSGHGLTRDSVQRAAAKAITDSLQHPLAFGAIMDMAFIADKPRASKLHPYGILVKRCSSWFFPSESGQGRRYGRRQPKKEWDVVRLMAETTRLDALSLAYMATLLNGWRKEMADAVQAAGLSELDAFMAAAKALSEVDVNWRRAAWNAAWRESRRAGDAPQDEPEPAFGDVATGVEIAMEEAAMEGNEAEALAMEPLDGDEAAPGQETVGSVPEEPAMADGTGSGRGPAEPPPGSQPTGAEAALANWSLTMNWLGQAADVGRQAGPSQAAVERLLELAEAARRTLAAWEEARPRLTDASFLGQRVRNVGERLARLPSAPHAPNFPEGDMPVDAAALAEAESLLTEGEAQIAQAEEAHATMAAIGADSALLMARMGELPALKGAFETAAALSVARLEAAIALVVDAAARNRKQAPGEPQQVSPPEPVAAEILVLDVAAGKPDAVAGVNAEAAPAMGAADGGAEDVVAQAELDAAEDALEAAAGLPEEAHEELPLVPAGPLAASALEDGSAAEVTVDPLLEAVSGKLDGLVRENAFGSAYHLRRAAEVVFPYPGELPFSAEELRLAAMSGHVLHAALQGSEMLDRTFQSAVLAVSDAAEGDVGEARRILLASVSAELAMFHPSLPGQEGMAVIEDASPELSEAFHGLREAVEEGARFGTITPALLRTVSEQSQDDRYVQGCREAVLGQIETFRKMHFNWMPANRICANLHMRNGVVGEYRARIEAADHADAAQASRAFAKEFGNRAAVMALAEQIERDTAPAKPRPLDGAARERLLSAFEDLVGLSLEYAEATEAQAAARGSHHKGKVQRIAQAVAAGCAKAIAALLRHADHAAPLPASAARFGASVLGRLKDAAEGRFEQPGIHDHLLAAHGPLLWLPGLRYGTSWLPAPYRAEELVTALLDAPAVPERPSTDAFTAAVRSRLDEGSFIAARMLVQAASFYGVDDQAKAEMADRCTSDLSSSRDDLREQIDDTRRLIDKVQRMGNLLRAEQAARAGGVATLDLANSFFAALDRIDPDALPADVSLDARTEEAEPEQILDISSAKDQIADIRDRVRGMLEVPRALLRGRLDALRGSAPEADLDKIRQLIEGQDDLVTAGEYVGFLEDGRDLPPEHASANRRLDAFFPAVLNVLSEMGKGALDQVRAAMEAGTDLPALPFSRVPAAARPQALEILDLWRDLRRRVERGDQAAPVSVLLERLLNAAQLSPIIKTPAAQGPKMLSKTYVAEMRLAILEDRDSLLLPDFGSLVDFTYRIAVVPRLPSDGEMGALCRDAGTFGMMVLVTSVVDQNRRRQLQAACLENNRRVLVVDEAIMLFALSEPEFRPLTLIECAQPFSFAAPYRDYDNAPVPPEMFFGRVQERQKIVDRQGSCIVYGGRRLGKTALLRHVRANHSDAEEGGSTAVGYSNLYGTSPGKVWEAASRDLKPIFSAPVATAAAFRERVERWLAEDSKRYVLLLLDEADRFIGEDSQQSFKEFGTLLSMMADSNRRFKVVLAGLHNVTRVVRTENSPLKQIASDPQRIGPLMDAELPEAELLVTKPFSALGYAFSNRSDVWRILSHCNYYPVLVQTFCRGLLSDLMKVPGGRRRAVIEISDRQVREALEDASIRKEIEEKFAFTLKIDERYELIAHVVADQVLNDRDVGRAAEGMSAVKVLDGAATWWPQAFDHPNALDTVKDLLDEMVGLGVLRQTATGAWTLRSQAILRLLGDSESVMSRLMEFERLPAPAAFEPRSMRRRLSLPREEPEYPCPLTAGQEHDLTAAATPVSVVFGSPLSDIGLVADALRSSEPMEASEARTAVSARAYPDLAAFGEAMRTAGRAGGTMILVVDARSPWDVGWVSNATRLRAVKSGGLRMVFVGGPEHALRWARDPRAAKLAGSVQVLALQTWSDALLDHRLKEANLPPDRFLRDVRRATGGLNRPMAWAFSGFRGHNHDRYAKHLEGVEAKLLKSPTLLADLGLNAEMAALFGRIAFWTDEAGRVGLDEIKAALDDGPDAASMTAAQAAAFGEAMALLDPAAIRPGEPAEQRAWIMSPLALSALRARQSQTEAA